MLQRDVDNGEVVHVWGRGMWEITIPSIQFCCEPKATLKTKVSFKKKHTKLSAHYDYTRNARKPKLEEILVEL